MSNDLSKTTKVEVPLSREELALCRDEKTIRVGDYFFHCGDIIRVTRIADSERGTMVSYDSIDDLERDVVTESYGSSYLDEFITEHRNCYIPDPFKLYQQAVGFQHGSYVPEEMVELSNVENLEVDASCTDLVSKKSPETLEAYAQHCRLLERRMNDLVAMSKYHAGVLQERMRNKMSEIQKVSAMYRKKLNKAISILSMIQLYLGEDQSVEQVLTGEPASMDEPLVLYQQVLYMAEECAILTDGGIDAARVDEFVEWLKGDGNIDLLLPDQRGIVALKPSRFTKSYGDSLYEAMMRKWNRHTYFLIRNGGNVYLLESDHIEVINRMFPLKKEMQEMVDRMRSEELAHRESAAQTEFDAKNEMYRRIVIFLQGLLDSTEILHPIRQGINLFNPEASEGTFRLVYNGEPSLTDGHLSFKEWRDRINTSLKRGSRIVFVGKDNRGYYESSYKDYDFISRHFLFDYNEYSMPATPESGVYTLDEYVVDGKDRLGFKYMPAREYGWEKKRSRRVTYLLSFDDLYLNYDRVSLEDVDFYLNSRLERKDFLQVLPTLITMRKELRKEQAEEGAFRQMLQGRLLSKGVSESRSAELIDSAIEWWKYKTITSRPIRSDDAKAMRMIEGRVNCLLEGSREG